MTGDEMARYADEVIARIEEWWNGLAPEKGIRALWWIALLGTTLPGFIIQFGNIRSARLADYPESGCELLGKDGLCILSSQQRRRDGRCGCPQSGSTSG